MSGIVLFKYQYNKNSAHIRAEFLILNARKDIKNAAGFKLLPIIKRRHFNSEQRKL